MRQGPAGLKDHLVAVFVTLHLMMVILYVLPNPPRTDDAALRHPDVAEELDRAVHTLHGLLAYGGSEAALKAEVVEGVRTYDKVYGQLREKVGWYLEPLGSTQTWNMFVGTPPRHPRVMVVEVRPAGAKAFEPFLDGRWGHSGDAAFSFRHRKVQNKLSIEGRRWARADYARYFGRQWNAAHPDRPAAEVRLSYLELHTPTARQVQQGVAQRPPDTRLSFTQAIEGAK